MDELSPEAKAALSALRSDLPDAQRRRQMRERLLAASVAGGAAALGAAGGAKAATLSAPATAGTAVSTTSVAAATLTSLSMTKLVIVVAGATALSAGAGAWHAGSKHVEKARSAQAMAQVTMHEEHAPQTPSGPRAHVTPILPEVVAQPPARPPPIPSHVTSSTKPKDQGTKPKARRLELIAPPEPALPAALQVESTLLLQALRLFESGHACSALQTLSQHEHEFGRNAQLAPERTRLRARILPTISDTSACLAQKGSLP